MTVSNYSIHNDARIWDEPDVFKPERFITEDGEFQAPKDGFFAFGAGKSCKIHCFKWILFLI